MCREIKTCLEWSILHHSLFISIYFCFNNSWKLMKTFTKSEICRFLSPHINHWHGNKTVLEKLSWTEEYKCKKASIKGTLLVTYTLYTDPSLRRRPTPDMSQYFSQGYWPEIHLMYMFFDGGGNRSKSTPTQEEIQEHRKNMWTPHRGPCWQSNPGPSCYRRQC